MCIRRHILYLIRNSTDNQCRSDASMLVWCDRVAESQWVDQPCCSVLDVLTLAVQTWQCWSSLIWTAPDYWPAAWLCCGRRNAVAVWYSAAESERNSSWQHYWRAASWWAQRRADRHCHGRQVTDWWRHRRPIDCSRHWTVWACWRGTGSRTMWIPSLLHSTATDVMYTSRELQIHSRTIVVAVNRLE